jgi:predicted PurR-regulated permease PerM
LRSLAILVTGLAAGIALLYFGRAFCITVVISVILAFLLEPFVALCMRARLPRGLAAFLVCTVALFGLYLTGLAMFTQLASLAEDLPEYTQRLNLIVDRIATEVDKFETTLYKNVVPRRLQGDPRSATPEPQPAPASRKKRNQPAPSAAPPAAPPAVPEVRIHQDRSPLVQSVAEYVSSFYEAILMISFVPFLVYFTLSWRDHISRTFLAMYRDAERPRAARSWTAIASMARAYVVGNVILGIIISVVSCIVFFTWHLPYWLLVGILSGFLSLIPYVGLPLAMIPAIMTALLTYDAVTPYLVICLEVGMIHLLALNLLYPAVVGARVHLNPMVVTVALMFWGTVWGAIGLVLAIPITAAVKAYLDNTESMQEYGRLMGDQTPPAVPPKIEDRVA